MAVTDCADSRAFLSLCVCSGRWVTPHLPRRTTATSTRCFHPLLPPAPAAASTRLFHPLGPPSDCRGPRSPQSRRVLAGVVSRSDYRIKLDPTGASVLMYRRFHAAKARRACADHSRPAPRPHLDLSSAPNWTQRGPSNTARFEPGWPRYEVRQTNCPPRTAPPIKWTIQVDHSRGHSVDIQVDIQEDIQVQVSIEVDIQVPLHALRLSA